VGAEEELLGALPFSFPLWAAPLLLGSIPALHTSTVTISQLRSLSCTHLTAYQILKLFLPYLGMFESSVLMAVHHTAMPAWPQVCRHTLLGPCR
jgi:hypothetical protein